MSTLGEYVLTKEIKELKLEISTLKKDKRKLKLSNDITKTSRDNYKIKATNVLKAVIKLREDGLIKITNKQIGERYFVSSEHVRSLSGKMRKEQL